MPPINISELAAAMDHIRALVLDGNDLQHAIDDASEGWDINPDILRRKVEESGWTEEGLRKTTAATAPRDIIAERIASLSKAGWVEWQVQFEAWNDKWTAVRAGRKYVMAIRHSTGEWHNIRIESIREPALLQKLEQH